MEGVLSQFDVTSNSTSLNLCFGDGLGWDELRFFCSGSELLLGQYCVLELNNLDQKGAASVSILALRDMMFLSF